MLFPARELVQVLKTRPSCSPQAPGENQLGDRRAQPVSKVKLSVDDANEDKQPSLGQLLPPAPPLTAALRYLTLRAQGRPFPLLLECHAEWYRRVSNSIV